MKRKTRLLLAAAVVAAVAVATGTVIAIGRGSGSTSTARPSGAATVLRIQPVDAQVSCGLGGAAAYIYLDDLQERPSPNSAAFSFGVAGWQLLLQYDPKVLRIQSPTDIELNPELSRQDADGDGITRSFFPVSNIDDAAGRALIGAASLVPAGPQYSQEEGIDPVAKGESLLLTTVRFQTVGHGSTTLTLSDPGRTLQPALEPAVADPSGKTYEPVTFKDAAVAVDGGDCPRPEHATAHATAQLHAVHSAHGDPNWCQLEDRDAPGRGFGWPR